MVIVGVLLALLVAGGALALLSTGGDDVTELPDGAELTLDQVPRTPPYEDAVFPWQEPEWPPTLVDPMDIRSGGPPPDGIPPIDDPKFVTTASADEWLADREPVLALVHNGEARAYPVQIMTWHEIVNDTVGGDPLAVTFCPLCNSAFAFDARVEATPEAREMLGTDETVLDFGTSGRLYRSNLVMYDRQTKSLWVQFTGQGITGTFVESELDLIPMQIIAWEDFKEAHPDAPVLSRDTGFDRNYGSNPYVGYDDADQSPFLFDGPLDDRLRPMDRVVAVELNDAAIGYPFTTLEELAEGEGVTVVHDTLGGQDLVVFYKPGTASALDGSLIAESRDIGAAGVYVPHADGQDLTFEVQGGDIVDAETGSVWNILGEATSGPLEGERLEGIVHDDSFWFVWASFQPETTIWAP